jgi:hypothetical protein
MNIIKKLNSSHYLIVIWLVGLSLWFFHKNLLGSQLTGWDTHDLGFVNFLYFTDAVASGYIPFWNPYIQSGVFFPTLNNAGLFTVFQSIFVIIAEYFNPAIVFEWMIQAFIVSGGIGSYFYFYKLGATKQFATFGAVAYVLVCLMPYTGQLSFIVSLSSLPWLLFIVHLIKDKNYGIYFVLFLGAILGMYQVSGYPWMNFINGVIVVLYSFVINKGLDKKLYLKLFFMLLTMTVVYILFMIPGLLDLRFNYSLFDGDFIHIEPRLRSMGVQPTGLIYRSPFQAFISLIDTRLADRRLWVEGVGLVIGFSLILTFFSKKNQITRFQMFWFGIGLFFFIYASASSLGLTAYFKTIPVFNSNRWEGLGLVYACISIIFLTIYRLATVEFIFKTYILKYVFILTLLNILLFNAEFSLKLKSGEYIQSVENRNIEVDYLSNNRLMASKDAHFYIYNDETWNLKKIPYNHGYNNLGNPWYWQFKNFDFIEDIFTITRSVQEIELYKKNSIETDNEFYLKYTKSITDAFPSFGVEDKNISFELDSSFTYQLLKQKLSPNSAVLEVASSNAALISFNTPFSPGWNVYLNDEKKPLVKVNGIFMGVLIPGSGQYKVEFKFEPISLYLTFSLAYLIVLTLLLVNMVKLWRAKKINQRILGKLKLLK